MKLLLGLVGLTLSLPWTSASVLASATDEESLAIATFAVDVTVPLGHRSMGVLPTKTVRILDPLEALGIVILGDDQPIVIVVVDWCELRNGAYDAWREALAVAAGTSPQRVLLSCVHQHDTPIADTRAAELLRSVGLANELYDAEFHDDVLRRISAAVSESLSQAQPLTHVGIGQAKVNEIASNRRIVQADGRITFGRGSRSAADPWMRDAPEGEIDPTLKTISFWNGTAAVCALSVYATHPMSHYGAGEVSADFPGLARRRRQRALPDVLQIYASGCSGDVTAGKFNDGSPATRVTLTDRLEDAMLRAWDSTTRIPLSTLDFRCTELQLEYSAREELSVKSLTDVLHDETATTESRILAAMGLSSAERVASGKPIDFPCVDFGAAQLVLFPGESFVGYQLMAQRQRPNSFVVALGYGECWPGYIPTDAAFRDGFDGHSWLWVSPASEQIMRQALDQILPASR